MNHRPFRPASRHLGAMLVVALGCAGPGPDNASDTIARISAGIEFFEARAAADPHDYLSQRQLIRRYGERFALAAEASDLDRAERAARMLLAGSPERHGAWGRLSAVYLMQHRFAESMAAADSAVALAPDDPDAVGAQFDAALAVGHYEVAHAALVRLPRRDISTEARWAAWHLLTGNSAAAWRAQEVTCAGLTRDGAPPLARAWCLTELGGIAGESGDVEEAEAIYRAALRAQPAYRGAVEGLADLALARADWGEARRLYREILSEAHPDLYRRLAEVETAVGRTADAAAAEARFAALVHGPEQEALQGPELVSHLLAAGPAGHDSALAVAERETGRRPTIESWELLARVHHARGEPFGVAAAEAKTTAIRLLLARLSAPAPAA